MVMYQWAPIVEVHCLQAVISNLEKIESTACISQFLWRSLAYWMHWQRERWLVRTSNSQAKRSENSSRAK
jgi:hypothetical protein